jgi:hypothetical protein
MVIEKFTEDGFRVEISHDQDAPSPREDDNLWTFVCWHRRYTLGDEKPSTWKTPDDFQRWWKPRAARGLLRPLYLYDHGGITISTGDFSDPWDSGQIGWAFLTAANRRKEYGKDPNAEQHALSALKGEVETYAMYLEGRVYEYQIYKEGDDSPVASCGDIYGWPDDAAKEARAAIKTELLPQVDQELVETLSFLP